MSYLPILTPPDDSEGRSGDLSAALYEDIYPHRPLICWKQPDLGGVSRPAMPWIPNIACLSYLPILTPPDDSEGRSGDLSAALYEDTWPTKLSIR